MKHRLLAVFFLAQSVFADGGWVSVTPDAAEVLQTNLPARACVPMTANEIVALRPCASSDRRLMSGITHSGLMSGDSERIRELVRGLDFDWRKCFRFVRDNIVFTPSQVRVELEVPLGVFPDPSRVAPKYGHPGGGMERFTTGIIPVNVLRVLK